jgi:filamentous hemagglutinin family protein
MSLAHAQIVLDGTLGPSGTLRGPEYFIGPNLGKQQGGNLFHSFQEFNINQGEHAIFFGPDNINNIISRVTGGHPSNIDGWLHSTIPNADIYFFNPAGILFGPNVRLNIPGSLYMSTADYLRLGNDGRFDATYPENTLLTVAPPAAFGFLDNDIASIEVNGSLLTMPPNRVIEQSIRNQQEIPSNTLSLVGGNININEGTLLSFGGNIYLESVASEGEISLNPITPLDNVFSKLGTITITDSRVDTDSKDDDRAANIDATGLGGGTIHIRAGQLLLLENGYIFADTLGEQDGRGITIQVKNLVLENTSRITTQAIEDSFPGISTGNAGSITINARQMSLAEGSQINSNTRTPGNAGDVTVVVTEKLSIRGMDNLGLSNASGILTDTSGSGTGGHVNIQAGELFMDERGVIRARSGKIGNNEIGILGDAGHITLQVNQLTLQNGAQINVSAGRDNLQGTANSGHLTINADESILIKGERSELLTNIFNQGEGGTIQLNTPILTIQDKGSIQAAISGDGQAGNMVLNVDTLRLIQDGLITTETLNNGQAGKIEITANNMVRTENGSIRSKTSGKGQGGQITINAKHIELYEDSVISSESEDTGEAGNIFIIAGEIFKNQSSHITTQTQQADGGHININANHLIYLLDGNITTNVKGGEGSGGNISIETPVFVVLDEAQIITEAKHGFGGDITINSQQFLASADKNNVLDASSDVLERSGNIVITAPDEDISGSLTGLAMTPLNADDLLGNICAGITRRTLSRFIVIDRNVPPKTPADTKSHYIRRADAPKPVMPEQLF